VFQMTETQHFETQHFESPAFESPAFESPAPGPSPSSAVEPSLLVIFGGTGDLARRKLIPALARLTASGRLHPASRILGVATNPENNEESYRRLVADALTQSGVERGVAEALCTSCIHYQGIGAGRREDYAALADRITEIERAHGLAPRRAFYLAVPIAALPETVAGLADAGLAQEPEGGFCRLAVEKPFGHDLASAQALVELLRGSFAEHQLFRIDHYLGKETVQNLLALRFGNSIFESLWNRDRIESVEIMVAEEVGLGSRAKYYESAGALRDMIQSHLIQVLSLVAMEVPTVLSSDSVRYEKTKVLRSIAPIGPDDIVFGQYGPGNVGGRELPGYLDEPGVRPESTTETFAALRLEVMNWRWQGVPFYLRTGKRLARRSTRIGVRFKSSPVCMFELDGLCRISNNVLVIDLQPDEGFALHIDVKRPGSSTDLQRIPLRFRYGERFESLPDAYETLLLDILRGDQTLFVHSDEVLESWRLFDPLLAHEHAVHPYPSGSWGPDVAERFAIRERDLMRSPL
jgi:glucose-6-phosphate 1-dehydrogenase